MSGQSTYPKHSLLPVRRSCSPSSLVLYLNTSDVSTVKVETSLLLRHVTVEPWLYISRVYILRGFTREQLYAFPRVQPKGVHTSA